AGHHPQGVPVDEDAGGVTGLPWRGRQFIPVHSIRRIPDIVAIALAAGVAFEKPQASVKDSYVVILARLPGGDFDMALPVAPVGGAPDVVVEISLLSLGRVISAAAQNPDAVLEYGAAADHAACRPTRFFGTNPLPLNAIGRRPDIAVKGFCGRGQRGNR